MKRRNSSRAKAPAAKTPAKTAAKTPATKTAAKASTKTPTVREPVQVYLDERDRDLLERVAGHSGLSRAEVLRRGLRELAVAVLRQAGSANALESLIGALGTDTSIPTDLSARHDEYLTAAETRRARRSRLD